MAKRKRPISLVTGACGFTGSYMVEVAHAAGHDVRATDRPEACRADDPERGWFPGVARGLGIEPVPADLTRPADLDGLADGVDYVFHVAGLFSYSASWEALKAVNLTGTRDLLQRVLAGAPGLRRFVLWGSGGVYGFLDRDGVPLREDDPPEPPNDYLRSKWRQEWAVMETGRQEGLPWTILRPTTVYGPRCVYGTAQLLLGAARMRFPVVPANFTARIPFVHALDVCRAALFLAERREADGEVFNVNDDTTMSSVEFIRYVAALRGRSALVVPSPIPPAALRRALVPVARLLQALAGRLGTRSPLEADSVDYVGREVLYSTDKLKALGFELAWPDARDGIRETLAWYEEQGWL